MRASLILAGGAALLWTAPAHAISPETACENAKLRGAGVYARCVLRAAQEANLRGAELSEEAIERCDGRFDRLFEEAEAGGACRTAGGPSSLRAPIEDQMTATFETVTAGPGCPELVVDDDGTHYGCTLTSGNAVDLAEIVAQIAVPDVTLESIVWIESWGGDGASGEHGGNGGTGGTGGTGRYAQMTTTVNDLLANYETSEIYYYLGKAGTGNGSGYGGNGGNATVISVTDLTQTAPSVETTLEVAGGGGGGGSGSTGGNCSGARDVLGGGGGGTGQAIAELGVLAVAPGLRGGQRRNTNHSGDGGSRAWNGSGGNGSGSSTRNGGQYVAPLGGLGGNNSSSSSGFTNLSKTKMSAGGGAGGPHGDSAGGGGGGGGFGAGGGGAEGDGSTDCVSGGGGGGGSLAQPSTRSCTRAASSNPNAGKGAVKIVFLAGACD